MDLSFDLIARSSSWLDLEDVQSLLVAVTGNDTLINSIQREYLNENYHFLLTTQQITSWEKRRNNTLAWMKYNNWKESFHGQIESESSMKGVENYLHTLEHCKPFYNLTASVERGILEITQYLIAIGHNCNEQQTIYNSHFESMQRPLNYALTNPCDSMLRYLLSLEDIELNYTFQSTFSNSIIHFAAGDQKVSLKNLNLFLSHPKTRASINVRDGIGKSPLHYLCWFLPSDYEEKMELLLKAGANASAYGNDYMDPLQVLQQASKHRRRDVEGGENLLKMYGAIEIRIGP